MDSAALIARMDAQRERWVDLPDGKRVKIQRPLEADFVRLRGGVTVEHVAEFAGDWAGFTEADLLGAAIGSSDALAFSPALWSRVVRDRVAYVGPVAEAIVAAITEHLQQQSDIAKN